MKMSKKNYERLTAFYNYTVENANDNDVEFILRSIGNAAAIKKKEMEGVSKEMINYNNPNLNKHNEMVIREFFEDFLRNANDNDAIYIIEWLQSLMRLMVEHPDKVTKYVIRKKRV